MMRIKTAADRKAKQTAKRIAKQEAMKRHRNRMQRLDKTKGRTVMPPPPEVNKVQPKMKTVPNTETESITAAYSPEDIRNMYNREDWENHLHVFPLFGLIIAFFKLFFKSIELFLAVIGIYVGETRRVYKQLLHKAEGMTDAELDDNIYNTLSNYTSGRWFLFGMRHCFQAFWNLREFAGDMFTLITIVLKRNRRIQILVLGGFLLIVFGVMYLYGLFTEVLFVYTFILDLFGFH